MLSDHYAVMGNPIEHSISPAVHQLFAEQTGQAIQYTKIMVALNGFEAAVKKFRDDGGKGLNITLPFKQQAAKLATTLSPEATLAKAVNTLTFQDNDIIGHNTDGMGLREDLEKNLNVMLARKNILILGAGGAAKGIIGPLMERKPSKLTIANRTKAKAYALAQDFSNLGQTQGRGLNELQDSHYDIIINATSASLTGKMPDLPEQLLIQGGCCYDLAYGQAPNCFLEWGKAQGSNILADGLGMLVEQAAISFYIWRGVKPETKKIIEQLKG